jgi:FkbM family methyltransferase
MDRGLLRQWTNEVVATLRRPRGVAMVGILLVLMAIELVVLSRDQQLGGILNLIAIGLVGIVAMPSRVSSRQIIEEQSSTMSATSALRQELNDAILAVRMKVRREGEIIRAGVLSLARNHSVPGAFYTAGTFDAELEIPSILAPHLQSRRAIDVGANRGEFTDALRRAGMSVEAFEPNPDLAAELHARFAGDRQVRVHAIACGNVNGEASLHVARAVDKTEDATIYASLSAHETFPGVSFESRVSVEVRRLDTIFGSGEVFGLFKIDTEGHDLDVLEGSDIEAETVLVEFWDEAYLFNQGRTRNTLAHYLKWFAGTKFQHHIVFWREDYTQEFGVTPGAATTPARSWGNILFVQNPDLVGVIAKWAADRYGPSWIDAGSAGGHPAIKTSSDLALDPTGGGA